VSMIQKSKSLARWLRHRPDAIKISLDKEGWTDIGELLLKANAVGVGLTRQELEQIVEENDKRRFFISEDGLRIRAAQGHSVPVNLNLMARLPPPVLYHGTVSKFIASIKKQGLLPGTRNDVHLSATSETALAVGARRGAAVLLKIETFPMVKAGIKFRCADNGVWLVDCVPVEFIKFP
jgi:putative RNA 2'-phosphotransferase